MTYHQSGRGQQGQYGTVQGSPTPQTQYNTFAPQPPAPDHYLRRVPSFDRGDDASYPQASNGTLGGQPYGAGAYRAGDSFSMQSGAPLMSMQNPQLPARGAPYTPGAGGYQHQDLPPAPSAQPGYNPQQYAPPQAQYSPQFYGGRTNSINANYQPYIPAAYQPAATQHQASYGGQTAQTYSTSMAPQTPFQTPPLPQRPYEHHYGNHSSSPAGTAPLNQYSSLAYDASYQEPPLFPVPTSAPLPSRSTYTPPAPPPPPFSPDRDAFPSNNFAPTSPRRFSHRNSISQSSQPRLPDHAPSVPNPLPPLPRYPSNGSSSMPSPNTNHSQIISPRLGLNNSLPPTPGTPGPTPPQHSPQRTNTTGRHPQKRPLPGPPPDLASHGDYFGGLNGQSDTDDSNGGGPVYDELMKEVEEAVMGRGPTQNQIERISSGRRAAAGQDNGLLFSGETHSSNKPDTGHSHTNGHVNALGAGQYLGYGAYSDKSDAEAEAGLAAMHMAEEQDAADELRRNSGAGSRPGSITSHQNSRYEAYLAELSSDSDVHVDMDTYGGGFSGHVHYGDQPLSHPNSQANLSDTSYQHRPSLGATSSQRSEISTDAFDTGGGMYDYSIPDQDEIHPFPPTLSARVDTGGTGGLAEPSPHPRRLSFEDGDEITLADSEGAQTSATQSPSGEGMPDMFFHPNPKRPLPRAPVGTLSNNRVPHLMPAGTYQHPDRFQQYDQYNRPSYPPAPDAYNQLLSPSGTPVPRSSSLISHGSALQTVPPLRSKTDADRARILKQHLMNVRGTSDTTPDSSVMQSAELLGLPEIPVGRRKKFNPSKLSTSDFKKCPEPWALSAIVAWIKEMSEGEADLKEQAIIDGIVALFTHKVPTMNTADAETLGARVVRSMFDSGTLLKEEEWVKFGAEPMSGVLFQITGTGCYSPRVHSQAMPGRCYAHHCMRTLKKINLHTQVLEPQRKVEDWATFYKVTKATIEAADKKEVERQNILHEIVTTEDSYMDQLNVLRVLYRDELAKWQPPIITPKRKDNFLRNVFGRADAVKQVNEDFLLAQLKYRQQEQGPWIIGFSDIFREWIRKAKNAYVDYAASFPNATFLVRQESDRNLLFRQFLDQIRENERSKRLGWDTYLKAPITRLQRYGLLLSTVEKNMPQDSEEKNNLKAAIEEIKTVTLECDARVAEMSKSVDLEELASKLVLRPGMEKVQLNLTHLGREIIFKGDLQRAGSNKITWLEIHAILFDHYLVLSKKVSQRDAAGGLKHEKYDVSKLPIPMDLLVLESTNDDPVVKSAKIIGGITTITQKAALPQDVRLNRPSVSNHNGTGGPGTLFHTNTASSTASGNSVLSGKTLVTATVLDGPKDERLMFPFRIRHLGKADLYTLYAPSAQNRQDWCDKIVEAKTRHAASLFKQNAEPFRLRVIADTAFGYDAMSGGAKSIVIRGTPLDRAVREVEDSFEKSGPRPQPVCRASVNCAVAFNQPYGNPMLAVGTDYGVFISEHSNARGWRRAININRVTQIAVLEEFSLLLIIADKSLIAYHLDSICPVSGSTASAPASDASSRRAPQKLSGNRDVGFFATGRMKDRTLVFYKKREGISSTFKVLEPVYQKSSTTSRGRFGFPRKGTTEFFRDFDDFYIPSETYAINLFHSSLAIATAKGFEVMTLDKKVPLSIPDLKPPDCASIAQRIRDLKPLGMFRLSDSEFLLVFEEVGIYVNKHGDVSRAVVMEFVGKAKQAVLYGGMYLVLVDQGGGFVEVRNAVNGRLRQVVSGRDVRLLDDGMAGGGGSRGSVKICMQHPEWERCQVVVEMIVNEGLKE